MAQPIPKIAEALNEPGPRLWEESLRPMAVTGASATDRTGNVIKGLATRQEGRSSCSGINDEPPSDPVCDALLRPRRLSPGASDPSPVSASPSEVLAIHPGVVDVVAPPMAPGIGGFNIDPPPPRTHSAVGDLPTADVRGEVVLSPDLVRPVPTTARQIHLFGLLGDSSLILLMLVTVIGLGLSAFPLETWKSMSPRTVTSLPDASAKAATSAQPSRLVVEAQKGFANEPLPLGVSLKGGSGGETVTVIGLAEGIELSLGAARDRGGWLMSGRDLDKTFVGPPKDFVGVVAATIELHSFNGELLDSQVIQLEWTEAQAPPLPPTVGGAEPPVFPPLDSTQIAALIKLGEDLLANGDIASARFLLKRAAIAGNAHAALELGMTFDQAFLPQWGVLGIASDSAQARQWYDRAIKLGSTEAARHLERLASMPE